MPGNAESQISGIVREIEDSRVGFLFVRHRCETQRRKLVRDFSGAIGGLGFDDQVFRTPGHDGDSGGAAECARLVEPPRLALAREERHAESIAERERSLAGRRRSGSA